MQKALDLWEQPKSNKITIIAGWRQWADAGKVSSGLPQYLIDHVEARKIGEMAPDGFYLFQTPVSQHLFRPEVRLRDGYRLDMQQQKNEFYYAGDERRGLVIFLGDEPHLNAAAYADAFLDAVESFGASRTVALGGVYGPMPYDKDRQISCVYSLRRMKEELDRYALRFSDYEGGTTIGTFLADRAEPRSIEFVDLYAMVPSYDFGQGVVNAPGVRIENDFKAWYDTMARINHMCNLGLDLSDLERRGEAVATSVRAEIEELDRQMPQLRVRTYLEKVFGQFTEMPFAPLDRVWEEGLRDILGNLDQA